MQSAEKNINVTMKAFVGDEMNETRHSGTLKEKDGKFLIRFIDDDNIKTSLKLDSDRIHLIRSGGHISHRLTVAKDMQTNGVMGETPFTVIGRRADYTKNDNGGEIRLNYTLPDISDSPMDFNIRILFEII